MISRRTFLLGAAAAGVVGLAATGYRASREFEVERLEVRLPGWSGPPLTLAFLALSVIPSLKITDRGLVDVDRFQLVPLEIR